MFLDEEITPEDEAEIIEWTALQLYKYGMETAAIMFLESLKPISRYGSSMGQVFVTPLLPILGDNLMLKGEKVFKVFEDQQNVEKLIQRLEDLAANGLENEKEEAAKEAIKEETSSPSVDDSKKDEKKGWRSLLPF